jgi:uncharacterized membrane protein
MSFEQVITSTALVLDAAGAGIIVIGAAIATVVFIRRLVAGGVTTAAYQDYRQGIGRSILLGLEFLIAGDIIRTVAISPTLQAVLVLGLIVLIRTFLSMALEVELSGRLPWRLGETGVNVGSSPPGAV